MTAATILSDFTERATGLTPNPERGRAALVAMVRSISGQVKVGVKGCEHEKTIRGIDLLKDSGWNGCSSKLAATEIMAVQLAAAHIEDFARTRGTRAQTDLRNSKPMRGFIASNPEVGRHQPDENLRLLGTMTTRKGQPVDMRKRPKTRVGARRKQIIPVDAEIMVDHLRHVLDAQINAFAPLIENARATRIKPESPNAA